MSESVPTATASQAVRRGTFAGAGAFCIWGTFPLFIKLLMAVPSVQILAHRALWCAVLVWGWLALRGDALWWRRVALRDLGKLCVSGTLISINWGVYIWAVNSGQVIETSLGYFMAPLVSVLFGVLFMRERPTRWQWFAIGAALTGVAALSIDAGRLPWLALWLAFSFGTYGLVRKFVPVEALHGLAFESLLLALPAGIWLSSLQIQGGSDFLAHGALPATLLVLSGAMTAAPLALFAYSARRIPFVTLGFLQYISPCLQLLLGIYLFHEPFGSHRAFGFAFIWLALIVYSVEGLLRALRDDAHAPGTPDSASR